MKTSILALFVGGLWLTFYAHTADSSQSPADGAQTPQSQPPAAGNSAMAISGEVARALFTRKVKDLEPVDNISVLSNDITRITYFTEIVGMAGQTITHRWEYNGKVLLEKKLEVGSSHWRAYSSKTLDPAWLGEWKASVVDAAGGTLCVNTFTYLKKSDAAVPATPNAVPQQQ